MKLKKYLILLALGIASIGIAIHFDGESGPRCDSKDRPGSACADPETNCQCWCLACGRYRDKKAGALGNDSPVYANGICYCNPRDRDGDKNRSRRNHSKVPRAQR